MLDSRLPTLPPHLLVEATGAVLARLTMTVEAESALLLPRKGLTAVVDDAAEGLVRSLGGNLVDTTDADPHEGRTGGRGHPALYRGGDGGAPPAGESRLDERRVPVGDVGDDDWIRRSGVQHDAQTDLHVRCGGQGVPLLGGGSDRQEAPEEGAEEREDVLSQQQEEEVVVSTRWKLLLNARALIPYRSLELYIRRRPEIESTRKSFCNTPPPSERARKITYVALLFGTPSFTDHDLRASKSKNPLQRASSSLAENGQLPANLWPDDRIQSLTSSSATVEEKRKTKGIDDLKEDVRKLIYEKKELEDQLQLVDHHLQQLGVAYSLQR
ncbi:Myrcene synthase, chloroplastic [Musa troglodytarum]|uniref:Myrcene synthase, chloroplastic n=1 Tax=Musa troglodytarum TaxID=320322 RepID=A0A9E7GF88_9LILI|nr:Myrcene synthase, chloroplastic [Musa troglodytarum]